MFGFKYFPILDDHIQYFWYPNAYSDMREVFFGIGTLSTRPLAGIFDVYVWGKLYGIYGAVLVLQAFISFFGVYFLKRALSEIGLRVGATFYIILLFLPVTAEAQYWLSASSRIMVGVFLSSASVLMFFSYKRRHGVWRFITFALLQLASMCLYEQVAIFSALLCVACFYRTHQNKKVYLILVVNLSIVAAFYLAFRGVGALGGRGKILLPSEIISHLVFMSEELYNVTMQGFFSLTANSFVRGVELIYKNPLFIPIILLLAVAVAYFYTAGREKNEKTNVFLLWIGIVLAFAPFAMMLVIKDSYLSYRTIYVPLIGLAIVADYIIGRLRLNKKIVMPLLFAVAVILCVACVSEVDDYKNTSEVDRQICTNVVNALDETVLSGERECYVVGTKNVYVSLNSLHAEHILSVTSSDWAFTGAVRYYAGRHIKRIVPIKEITDEVYNSSAQIVALYDDYTVGVIRE